MARSSKHSPGGKPPKARREKSSSRPRAWRRTPLALAALAFLLYAGTLSYEYVLDDDVITRRHTYVEQGLSGIPPIFATNYLYGFNRTVDLAYRPIPLAFTAMEIALYGNQPHRHHLGNVLLYVILAIVTWWTLTLLVGSRHPSLPWLASALFIAHPIHTEVVANIKGREELLAALFGILSLGFLMKGLGGHPKATSLRYLALALLAYLAAVFSKETAYAFFPIALLALAALGSGRRRAAKIGGGYAAVTLFSLIVRLAVSHRPGVPTEAPTVINNALLAASGAGERLATISEIFVRYLGLLVFPRNLSFDYSYNAVPIVSWGHPLAILGALLLGGSVALVWIARRRFGRDHPFRTAAFFLAALWLSLVPGSNLFFLTGSTMAERFVFVPCLAFAGLLALGLEQLARRISPPPRGRAIAIGVASFLILAQSVKTLDRARDWKSNERLFQTALITTPQSARVHHHLASSLREKGEAEKDPAKREALLRQALVFYQDALRIQPQFAEAEYNAGVTYYDLADTTQAEAAYRRALAIDPDHIDALNNLGVIAFQRKDAAGAEAYFQRVVQRNPWHVLAVANLGASITAQGQLERAREVYGRGLTFSPDDPKLLQCLVEIATRMGDAARAQIYRDRLQRIGL